MARTGLHDTNLHLHLREVAEVLQHVEAWDRERMKGVLPKKKDTPKVKSIERVQSAAVEKQYHSSESLHPWMCLDRAPSCLTS